MKRALARLLGFHHRQDGVAYLEFAVALPFLLALFLGSVELTRYIIIVQKVEKSSRNRKPSASPSSTS